MMEDKNDDFKQLDINDDGIYISKPTEIDFLNDEMKNYYEIDEMWMLVFFSSIGALLRCIKCSQWIRCYWTSGTSVNVFPPPLLLLPLLLLSLPPKNYVGQPLEHLSIIFQIETKSSLALSMHG